MREGLGYEEEADDLKINLGEHLLRAVFARPASSAWVSQGASPSSQYGPDGPESASSVLHLHINPTVSESMMGTSLAWLAVR